MIRLQSVLNSGIISAEQERGVLSPEAKAIVDGFSDLLLDRFLRYIEEVTALSRAFQIDGGMNAAVFNHQHRCDGFNTP